MIKKLLKIDGIKGWIFDLDGVLTDTAIFHYKAWKKMADEEGLTFNENINEKLRGVSRRASLEIILDGLIVTEDKILDMMKRKNGYYRQMLEGLTSDDILPGILPLLLALKNMGKKLAIGSASRNTDFIVDHLNIRSYFDGIAHGGHVNRAKPAPDVFLHAAGQIGLAVDECIVVEDARAGVEGALKAGFRAIGVGPEDRVGFGTYHFLNTQELDPQ
ncbi:MAG: beta-phosphoglucomutase [Spirochaetaceae bacterium]